MHFPSPLQCKSVVFQPLRVVFVRYCARQACLVCLYLSKSLVKIVSISTDIALIVLKLRRVYKLVRRDLLPILRLRSGKVLSKLRLKKLLMLKNLIMLLVFFGFLLNLFVAHQLLLVQRVVVLRAVLRQEVTRTLHLLLFVNKRERAPCRSRCERLPPSFVCT